VTTDKITPFDSRRLAAPTDTGGGPRSVGERRSCPDGSWATAQCWTTASAATRHRA